MAHPDLPWWRTAAIYQVYIRSFADGSGDGVGDIAGIRCRLRYLRDLGDGRALAQPLVRLPDGRRGLRRRRLPRYRPALRDARRGRGAGRRGARARSAGHRRHRPEPLLRPAPVVPGGARRRPGLAGARLASGSVPGRGADGDEPPNDWPATSAAPRGQRVPSRRAQWYLHLFAPEQPDFNWDEPGGARRVRGASCASGSTAAWTASASTSPTALEKQDGLPDAGPHPDLAHRRSRTAGGATTSGAHGAA